MQVSERLFLHAGDMSQSLSSSYGEARRGLFAPTLAANHRRTLCTAGYCCSIFGAGWHIAQYFAVYLKIQKMKTWKFYVLWARQQTVAPSGRLSAAAAARLLFAPVLPLIDPTSSNPDVWTFIWSWLLDAFAVNFGDFSKSLEGWAGIHSRPLHYQHSPCDWKNG